MQNREECLYGGNHTTPDELLRERGGEKARIYGRLEPLEVVLLPCGFVLLHHFE